LSSRGEDVPNHIGGDFLLDGDGSIVSYEKLLDLALLLLEILVIIVVVVLLLRGFGDGFDEVCRREKSA